jgi:hypothetical protein
VKTTLRALTEIRIRRSEEVSPGREPDRERDHLWIPNNQVIRERLVRAVVLGNRIYGPLSHWIIGSKAAKPDDVALVSKALDEFEAKSGKTPELAAARQALRRQAALTRVKTGI